MLNVCTAQSGKGAPRAKKEGATAKRKLEEEAAPAAKKCALAPS